MAFSSMSSAEKIKVLQLAKKEVEAELYKNLGKLGYDPDTYALSSWNFDSESTTPEEEPDYHTKKAITAAKARTTALAAKIAQLS
jgi:hypothetical protein